MALTKVSGGILDPGINVAGIVTATGFDGPFTGGSSSNINAGIITATGFDLNGNGDISGNLVIGGNLTANGDFTTLNTTLREVEILRVDANTSAVAGIITQRGSGDIFSVYDTNTEVFKIADGGTVGIGSATPLNTMALDVIGSIRYSAAMRGATGSNATPSYAFYGDHDTGMYRGAGVNILSFATGGTERLNLDANGNGTFTGGVSISGVTTMSGNLTISNTAPVLYLTDTNADSDYSLVVNGGVFRLRDETTSGGVNRLTLNSSGVLHAMTPTVVLGESTFGSSSITKVYSGLGSTKKNALMVLNPSASVTGRGAGVAVGAMGYSDDYIGTLYAQRSATGDNRGTTTLEGKDDIVIKTNAATSTVTAATFDTSGRVLISNTLGLGGATSNPGDLLHAQSPSGEGKISLIGATDGILSITAINGDSKVQFGDSGTENAGNITYDHGSDSLSFRVNGNTRWKFDSSGHFLPDAVGSYNIGSANAEIGNVFLADSRKVFLGSDQDASIHHDGTHGYLANTTGNLFVTNTGSNYTYIDSNFFRVRNSSGSHMFDVNTGGSHQGVGLYYSPGSQGTEKLRTSATGITVTGEVAASQDYPNTKPLLDFNFAATKKLDPRLEYQRTGPASFVNEFGNIVLVGDNTPRFDHDPVTRESKGILIEEQRSNDVANSQNVGGYSGGYMAGGTFTYPDDVVAPDGSTEGVLKIVSDTSTGYHGVQYTISGFGSNQNWAYQVWVKALPGSSINLISLYDNAQSGATNNGSLVMNTTTGVFTYNGNNAESVAYNNGWYQIKIKGNRVTTNAQSAMLLVLYNGTTNSFAGDGSSGFYVWGGQYENDTHHWTSFIPTYGTIATRGRDELTMSGSDLTDVFNNEEGTMFYEASLGDLTNDNQPIVAFRDLGTNTASYHAMGMRIGGGSSGNIRTWFKSASNNEHLSNHSSTGLTANMFYKHIYGYKDADCADAYRTATNSGILATGNGSVTGNGTPMIAAGVVDELRFGGYYSYESQPDTYGLDAGHIKRFSYWPQKLTNAQLTTYIS